MASAKHEEQAQIFRHAPHLIVRLSKSMRRKEIKREIKREKKLTVTQGGTQTHNLANGLPCCNQLSY